jgi:hypothetical protein
MALWAQNRIGLVLYDALVNDIRRSQSPVLIYVVMGRLLILRALTKSLTVPPTSIGSVRRLDILKRLLVTLLEAKSRFNMPPIARVIKT